MTALDVRMMHKLDLYSMIGSFESNDVRFEDMGMVLPVEVPFASLFYRDIKLDRILGRGVDFFGEFLMHGKMGSDSLWFDKSYIKRPSLAQVIKYSFEKGGNIWRGSYKTPKGKDNPRCQARVVLMRKNVKQVFVSPESLDALYRGEHI
jgi:hypothetical protein